MILKFVSSSDVCDTGQASHVAQVEPELDKRRVESLL